MLTNFFQSYIKSSSEQKIILNSKKINMIANYPIEVQATICEFLIEIDNDDINELYFFLRSNQ